MEIQQNLKHLSFILIIVSTFSSSNLVSTIQRCVSTLVHVLRESMGNIYSACIERDNTREGVVIDNSNQQPPLSASAADLQKLLQIIEQGILPKTRNGVKNGNKVFGAALLSSDLDLVIAETNNETDNPLFHGEVNLINEWSKITPAADRGPFAQKSIFLSTHEPCCMCIRYERPQLISC